MSRGNIGGWYFSILQLLRTINEGYLVTFWCRDVMKVDVRGRNM